MALAYDRGDDLRSAPWVDLLPQQLAGSLGDCQLRLELPDASSGRGQIN